MESVKRWQMFLIAPADLLRLLRFVAGGVPLQASPFPPDTRAVDAFFAPERGYFVIVLESQFFEEVAATLTDGVWNGHWNELVFSLDEPEAQLDRNPELGDDNWQRIPDGEVPAPPPLPTPPPSPPTAPRWEAYFIHPAQVLQLLRLVASGAAPDSVPLPPDAVLRDAGYVAEQGAFLLVIESENFAPVSPIHDNGAVRFAVPDRFLTLEPPAV